ncbi:MAG: zinc-dependent peptidase [Ferruginibacter sp.]
MPFDTTYHPYPTDNTVSSEIYKPGGKDTDIYLAKGEHIPYVDSILTITDSITQVVESRQYQTGTQLKEDEHYVPSASMAFIFIGLFIFAVIMIKRHIADDDDDETDEQQPAVRPDYLAYHGDELDFPDGELVPILEKHFPYFNKLEENDRTKFLHRLNNFMDDKTFMIHGRIGFKEMPVLISAAAVQLTFGLKKYLLPDFTRIHIYPEEYVAPATLHIIEGNVQGRSINFSWKHFLDGFRVPDDGQNVGLHEMAHALYSQTFIFDKNTDDTFEGNYHEFNSNGKKVFDEECSAGSGLYSDYAKTNFQEFWAESIELFFEKPLQLRTQYRELYTSLCEILNQNPGDNIVSVNECPS